MQAQTPAAPQRAILELRYFHLRSGRQVEKTTAYLQHGWVPAAERAGIRPVGCFNAVIAPDTPFMLTMASYPGMAAFDAAREKLAADKEFQTAVDEYNTIGELSYIRMENSLLSAFPSFPSVTPPPAAEQGAARVFEIRTYESPTDKGLARKIKMFGEGEFDIFRRLHMLPVFAGQTIVGTHMPNLTYMLAFDDLAAREKCWNAFSADPE
jgi:NIPSNAP